MLKFVLRLGLLGILNVGIAACGGLVVPVSDSEMLDIQPETVAAIKNDDDTQMGDSASATMDDEAAAQAVADTGEPDHVIVPERTFEVLGVIEPKSALTIAQEQILASLPSKGVAPELKNVIFLNSEPLTLADLRGKVIIIEFWTYG